MSRAVALVSLIVLLPLGQATRAADDGTEDAMISAVLKHEAQVHRSDGRTCVSVQTRGATFDETRSMNENMKQIVRENPGQADALAKHILEGSNVHFRWETPARALGSKPSAEIDVALASRLNAAAAHAIAETPKPLSIDIRAEQLPPPLLAAGTSERCASLSLSMPVVQDDVAFIETAYVCGGLCGNGWLYALQRKNGSWEIVAVAFTWIS